MTLYISLIKYPDSVVKALAFYLLGAQNGFACWGQMFEIKKHHTIFLNLSASTFLTKQDFTEPAKPNG